MFLFTVVKLVTKLAYLSNKHACNNIFGWVVDVFFGKWAWWIQCMTLFPLPSIICCLLNYCSIYKTFDPFITGKKLQNKCISFNTASYHNFFKET